jgi:glycosyltransferase involved in cell wall biosynthesis
MEGVSVVIPCYNAAKYIGEAIQSVLDQRYDGPLEVLVADDGSTDGSREIIASYGPPVRLLPKEPQEQRSASRARNRCLRAATQPLVAFLDADDLWLPGHLSALADAMTKQPSLGLAYDKGYFAWADGRIDGPVFPEPYRPRVTPDELILKQCFPPAAVMVRRDVFAEVGLFDQTLRHAEDHDMWLRILEKYPAAHVPFFGFKYRQHGAQKSLKPTLWEDGAKVFANACRRYPYRWNAVRKRKAVLAFRFSQIAFREKRLFGAICQLLKAIALDPTRACCELPVESCQKVLRWSKRLSAKQN